MLLATAILTATSFPLSAAPTGRTRESFDAAWSFARFGPMPDGSTNAEPAGLENPALDDSAWLRVNTPHDWAIAGPLRADLPNNTGKLPWAGIGWYRKTLTLSSADQGRRIYLDFDGANVIAVHLDNSPGAARWYPGGGIFRHVWLDKTAYFLAEAGRVLPVEPYLLC